MSQLTIDSASQSIYENLLTTMVQDIVARTTTQAQTLRARYGKSPEPYYYDASGNLDIQGMPKQQESSLYFHCDHCNRDVSVNRFAAHVERCLSRGRRGVKDYRLASQNFHCHNGQIYTVNRSQMSQLLGLLDGEFGKLRNGASDGQTHLKKCLDDTHEFKMNIKKLKSYLNKQMQENSSNETQANGKTFKKKQLAVDKMNKLHKQWESGIKKNAKNALHQHVKYQKSVLNSLYDFELDQVYTNQLPSDARKHIESAIGLHISRYCMSEIPVTESSAMVKYLKDVYNVDPSVSSQFVEMSQIIRELRQGNLEPCMQWCTEGSTLEFELHLLKAMYLLQTGDKLATYQYLLNSIPSFMKRTKKTYLRHQVAPLLVQLVVPSETGTKLEDQRNKCIELFSNEYCTQSRLPFKSPMLLIVLSGVISFQFFIKYRALRAVSHVDWSTKNELPFDVQLPEFLTNFHPVFICPVLKEETTKENPPYALPCHHIISKFSLDKMSKNGTCNFKCPYCPIMAARSKTVKVNFIVL